MTTPLSLFAEFESPDGSFWLPPPGSSMAGPVDWLFHLLLGISAFFFALIVVLMVVFVVLYRQRPGRQARPSPSHNTVLEIIWTAIPVAIVIVLFYEGFVTYMQERTPPANAYDIRVIAKQWQWNFQYPNGYVDGELHVPVDEPIRLTMESKDVIHSFFVPDFRVKMDVVPGRYTTTWFRAIAPGEHGLYCAGYCGKSHSDMVTKVIVHPRGEFEQWLAKAGNLRKTMTPVQYGEYLYRRNCTQCHTIDGSVLVGPSFKGIYGKPVRFADGTSAVVDDNYIRESILEPQAKIVLGFPDAMSTYKGLLTDDEIRDLIEFIKSLK